MTVSNSQNLNAHYSSNIKVVRPENPVAIPPESLPSQHLFNDKDAKSRMNTINQDIYQDYKREGKSDRNEFLKILGCSSAAILGAIGLKNFFNK